MGSVQRRTAICAVPRRRLFERLIDASRAMRLAMKEIIRLAAMGLGAVSV